MAHVLIVEDEKTLNSAYKTILEKEGHQVATAFNGVEALDAVAKKTPDIILLDLLMPKMDGIEFLRTIKLKEKYPHTAVVILSNLDMDSEIQQAFELGAYKYILKAITSPQQLAVLVNHLITKNLSPHIAE
jgi:CheY-like chemotaxis protein